MPVFQDFNHILQAKTFGVKQKQIVEKQVSRFIEEKLIVIIFCFYHHFHSFLANFLGNFVQAFGEEVRDITLSGTGLFPEVNYVLQVEQEIFGMIPFAPAGIGPGMAGGSEGVGLDKQRIVVTINSYALEFQEITTFLPFRPESLL